MTTVSIFAPELSGTTGNTLYLRKSSDYSLVNTGGDSLTESGTTGWFAATVAEAWTEQLSATIVDSGGLIPRSGWLGVGAVVVSDARAELDSDAQAMVTAFNAMRSGNVYTAPALANAPTGGSGSGSGARTVTITVNDGTTVLENCIVRLTEGANTFTALTNSSGVAVFNLDDATYTVGITKPGYTYSGTSLVVNGTETATYSMTAISISNPTAGKVARRSIPVTVVDRVT